MTINRECSIKPENANRFIRMVKQTCGEYAKLIKNVIDLIRDLAENLREMVSTEDKFGNAVVGISATIIVSWIFIIYVAKLPFGLSYLFICGCFCFLPFVFLPVYSAFYNCYVAEKTEGECNLCQT